MQRANHGEHAKRESRCAKYKLLAHLDIDQMLVWCLLADGLGITRLGCEVHRKFPDALSVRVENDERGLLVERGEPADAQGLLGGHLSDLELVGVVCAGVGAGGASEVGGHGDEECEPGDEGRGAPCVFVVAEGCGGLFAHVIAPIGQVLGRYRAFCGAGSGGLRNGL